MEESRAGGTSAGDEAVSADAAPDSRAAGRLVGGTRRPKGTGPGRARVAERGRRRLRWAYALAAAVLVAGSAVTTWEVTRAPAVADRVAALSAGSGTIATVVVHRNGADVVTDALPANTGRGTAYYVWGVPATDGGTPQVVGTFEVTASGLHSYPLRVTRPLESYPVLAISEERAGSTPTAPSRVLGKGALGG
jgi:anti-sigma-K factor RskA